MNDEALVELLATLFDFQKKQSNRSPRSIHIELLIRHQKYFPHIAPLQKYRALPN